jgi:hypothetical protein
MQRTHSLQAARASVLTHHTSASATQSMPNQSAADSVHKSNRPQHTQPSSKHVHQCRSIITSASASRAHTACQTITLRRILPKPNQPQHAAHTQPPSSTCISADPSSPVHQTAAHTQPAKPSTSDVSCQNPTSLSMQRTHSLQAAHASALTLLGAPSASSRAAT